MRWSARVRGQAPTTAGFRGGAGPRSGLQHRGLAQAKEGDQVRSAFLDGRVRSVPVGSLRKVGDRRVSGAIAAGYSGIEPWAGVRGKTNLCAHPQGQVGSPRPSSTRSAGGPPRLRTPQSGAGPRSGRYTYIFSAEHPLDQELPLTINPTSVHMRSFGERDYLVGCPPKDNDPVVDVDDFDYPEPI